MDVGHDVGHDSFKSEAGDVGVGNTSAAVDDNRAGYFAPVTIGGVTTAGGIETFSPQYSISSVDPGLISAAQSMVMDSNKTAQSALLAAMGLATASEKMSGELSAQSAKTPIQQIYPVLGIIAIAAVAIFWFWKKG
jgi:hypothetical protein